MKGRNFRKLLGLVLLTSALSLSMLGVIIWFVTAEPYCTKQKDTLNTRLSGVATIDNLELNLADRQLTIKGKSNILAQLSTQLTNSENSEGVLCNGNNNNTNEICLNYGSYNLQITPHRIDELNCELVSHEAVPEYDNITDCIDMGRFHWYGGAEVYNQLWPVEKWSHSLQEFIPGDAFFPGNYGGVLERYWLTSEGVAFFISADNPLHVSINQSGDARICFISKYKDSLYQNIDATNLKLVYNICHGNDLKSLHTSMAANFWSKPSGMPHRDVLMKPIWSTWAVYKKDINDSRLLEYAEKIIAYNLSISQIEIDDNWNPNYGDLIFDTKKFPNAAATVKQVKDMVPAVTVWVHPFVNVDSQTFLYAMRKKLLMAANNEKTLPSLTSWWDGVGGLLDFSIDATRQWFLLSLKKLQDDYKIDSFKFDAGETNWMPFNIKSNAYANPSDYVKYYVDTVYRSDLHQRRQEVRVGCQTQHAPILVRMMDRQSNWDYTNGLKTLIPTALTFGLLGYPFVLPDMIGGNAYSETVEKELYIRWLQVNVFLPSIQFSIPPWQFGDPSVIDTTIKFLALRESYQGLFLKLAQEAVDYGWPIVRPLWWICPDDDVCQTIDNEFLLGNDLLVSPVLERNMTSRHIYLPKGQWKDMLHHNILEGGKWYEDYSASLTELPYFCRQ